MKCTVPLAAVVLASEVPPVATGLVAAEAHPAANSPPDATAMANAKFLRKTDSSSCLAAGPADREDGATEFSEATGVDHRAFALFVSLSTDHATDEHQLAAAG
jgi:hypothetical protein